MKLECPIVDIHGDRIEIAHGGGGKKTTELIEDVFRPYFDNEYLAQEHDGAIFSIESGKMAFTTDSFVVSPLFFPGGNIGDLAINGTVNDLLCCGAFPQYISCGFIIEEGFEIEKLRKIVESMSLAARKAGALIVTGDTKVVEKGKCDGVFINTAGIGSVRKGINLSPFNVIPGDVLLITGEIGNHGVTLLSQRNGLEFTSSIKSDTAALTQISHELLRKIPETRVLRDSTRGGVAAVLNEIANSAKVTININEDTLPINKDVDAACRLLGINALHIANEGVMIAIVPKGKENIALSIIQESEHGGKASIIGEIVESSEGMVTITLPLGQKRRVDVITGEQLPRIC